MEVVRIDGGGMTSWIVIRHVTRIIQEAPDLFRVYTMDGGYIQVTEKVAVSIKDRIAGL